MGPDVLNFVFAFSVGDNASAVLLFHLADFTVGLLKKLDFFLRNHHVIDTNGYTSAGGFAEAELFKAVECLYSDLLTAGFVAAPNDVRELFLTTNLIVKSERLGPDLVEDNASCCRLDHRLGRVTIDGFNSMIGVFEEHASLRANGSLREGQLYLVGVVKERHAFGFIGVLTARFLCEVVAAERNVL